MNTKEREALKLALEGAANYIDTLGGDSRKYRQALAEQPAQEPVALGYMNAGHVYEMQQGRLPYGYVYPKEDTGASVAVYTSPPQRKPLTDEQIKAVIATIDPEEQYLPAALRQFARAIEAAHGIKVGA